MTVPLGNGSSFFILRIQMRSKTDMDNAMITGNIPLYLLFDPIFNCFIIPLTRKTLQLYFLMIQETEAIGAAPDSPQSYRNNFKLFGKYCKLMPFSPLLPYL